MEKEIEKTTETTEETKPTEQVDNSEKVENKPVEEKKVDEVEKSEEKCEECKGEEQAPTQDPQVQNAEPQGNGISIDQVVTKDMLSEMFSSFSAKLDAILEENKNLKEKLATSESKVNDMQNKYENKDFGNYQAKGTQEKNTSANETFEEYSKRFM